MNVKYVGLDNRTYLHGYGLLAPGQVISIDDNDAQRLLAQPALFQLDEPLPVSDADWTVSELAAPGPPEPQKKPKPKKTTQE